jgi:16S rRNA (cytosine1402-N4)-methyltransferase
VTRFPYIVGSPSRVRPAPPAHRPEWERGQLRRRAVADPRTASDAHGARHIPVLVEETVAVLAAASSGVWIDCTVGLGGHATALLSRDSGEMRLIGFDRDTEALEVARTRLAPFGDRVRLVHADYADMEAHLAPEDRAAVAGILIDAGLSSLQIDRAARGFSFEHDGPLDMRADVTAPRTAADVLNDESEETLTRILTEYGEVPRAWDVARALIRARQRSTFTTTHDVVRAIRREISPRFPRRSFARVFQAIRIEVNDELGRLRRGLRAAERVLRAGGVLAVISYHSLEDREVKHFLRDGSRGDVPRWNILTRHVVRPSSTEVTINPRARSARLRAARRTMHATS